MVCRLIGLFVTIINPAKTTELMETWFGLWTQVGPRNHVLDGVQIPPAKGNFDGGGAAHCSI